MTDINKNNKSPADYLLDALSELDNLTEDVRNKLRSTNPKDKTSSDLQIKLFAEYRHLLKLRFDVIKRMAPLIDEAQFHQKILSVIRAVDEQIHDRLVAALWKLDDDSIMEDDDQAQ